MDVNPFPGKGVAASDEIALCLSGGGYRAAAFHLGTLDVLERLGLIAKVRVLATISGGSLVGVLWTLARARGIPFPDFFRRFYRGLAGINVVAEAFAGLAATSEGGRRPSLARAAARVYARPEFAGEARLGELMASDAVPDDVLFCSTEMATGLAFRFQASRRARKPIVVGTRDVLHVSPGLARELHLADVIAASACFPGAFEPMLFPSDFALGEVQVAAWKEAEEERQRKAQEKKAPEERRELALPLPLVDGGVFDNHGLDAARRAYDRADMAPGLILVSDSSPRENAIYQDRPGAPPGWLSLGGLAWLARGLALLAAALALSIGNDVAGDGWRLTDVIALCTCLAIFGLLHFGRQRLEQLLAKVREVTGVEVWDGVEKISLGQLMELVDRRARSLVSITSTVFLKRVRSLQQLLCFVDAKVRDRVVFSLIYTLLEPAKKSLELRPELAPGPALKARAAAAEKVATALWIGEDELRSTIVAGQATTLHKLLELHYLGRLEPVRAVLGAGFETAARELWERLKADPESLLVELIPPPDGGPAAG